MCRKSHSHSTHLASSSQSIPPCRGDSQNQLGGFLFCPHILSAPQTDTLKEKFVCSICAMSVLSYGLNCMKFVSEALKHTVAGRETACECHTHCSFYFCLWTLHGGRSNVSRLTAYCHWLLVRLINQLHPALAIACQQTRNTETEVIFPCQAIFYDLLSCCVFDLSLCPSKRKHQSILSKGYGCCKQFHVAFIVDTNMTNNGEKTVNENHWQIKNRQKEELHEGGRKEIHSYME